MSKRIIQTTILAVGLLLGSAASAAIVNITATGTVDTSDSSQFVNGDLVTWTIQYDDADADAVIYNDGDNFIAEGGFGDDTVNFTAVDDGTNDYADVVFDFGDIFIDLLDGKTHVGLGYSSSNLSILENGVFSYSSDADFFLGYSNVFRVYSIGSIGSDLNELTFSSVSYDVSAVPLPAALWLFGPALLGFMGFRRRALNA